MTIRLLDPPLHEFLPAESEAATDRMRDRIRALHEVNPMLGTRGCRLGLQWPEIYEMQLRAIGRAAKAVADSTGKPPRVEIMHPLVAYPEELHRLRELTERVMAEEAPGLDYLCGTMIELPRAALQAAEIAVHADFFSFGTNDLTQTALGLSRDDAEGRFLTTYLEQGVLEHDPFETLDQDGVGELISIGVTRGRKVKPEPRDRDLRRARRRPELDRLLPQGRTRLRVLLTLPRATRPPGGRPSGPRRAGRELRRGGWLGSRIHLPRVAVCRGAGLSHRHQLGGPAPYVRSQPTWRCTPRKRPAGTTSRRRVRARPGRRNQGTG